MNLTTEEKRAWVHDLAYMLYVYDWYDSRGIISVNTPDYLKNLIDVAFNQPHSIEAAELAFHYSILETLNTEISHELKLSSVENSPVNGETPACAPEFYDHEYKCTDYICELLDDPALIQIYQLDLLSS